jgi:hypothetical protein
MIYHTAYFWLKPNLNKEELLNFEKGLQSLQGISLVKDGNYGSPAATLKRSVIEDSYSYANLLVFDDVEDQDKYQDDPVHVAFVERHQDKWDRVQVFDFDTSCH